MKELIRRGLAKLSISATDQHGVSSYSQQGEDMVLRCLLQSRRYGFFVDVGAHHPQRYSNTYHFYRAGWRGINIDATPGSMRLFTRLRPRDTNLEMAIGDAATPLTYYLFNEPALNGFSKELPESLATSGRFRVVSELTLIPHTLAEVLSKHVPKGQPIDFLTVDAEAFDVEVLKSNDWSVFRPSLVVAEDNAVLHVGQLEASKLFAFMTKQGYRLCAKTMHSLVFVDANQIAPNGVELRG